MCKKIKITDEQRREIIKLYDNGNGLPTHIIAKKYNINECDVVHIVTNK